MRDQETGVGDPARSGPFGFLGILFTPRAMIVAQTLLVLPIVAALTRQNVEDLWMEYRDELTAMRVGPLRRVITLLWDARFNLVTTLLGDRTRDIEGRPSTCHGPRACGDGNHHYSQRADHSAFA